MIIVPGSAFLSGRAGDPYGENVVLLLHMDGSDGSTTFTDEKGKTVTAYNNAQIATEQGKFGQSGQFDGTGDYIRVSSHTDLRLRKDSESWCVEFQIYPTSLPASQRYIIGDTDSVWWTMQPTGIRFDYFDVSFIIELNINEWTHLAFVSEHAPIPGSPTNHFVVRMYKNGTEVWSGDISITVSTSASVLEIGCAPTIGGGSNGFSGYMDEFRVTKGVPRYTTDFTVPSAPFPNS